MINSKLIKLLSVRRFLPLFVTQFLEAFNDNFFRNALLILVAYKLSATAMNAESMSALFSAIYIIPFFIFSATAGKIADKYEKTTLIRIIKIIEIIAMLIAAVGFARNNIQLLILTLFLLGTHSAMFGPIKYAILPQHLHENELISGNALVEASTFLAILFGTILGGLLISFHIGTSVVAILGVLIAVVGLATSLFIPKTPPQKADIKVSWNIAKETWAVVEHAVQDPKIFAAIFGISWFWLVGISFMTEFPSFTKITLGASPQVVSLFLAFFLDWDRHRLLAI